MSDKLRGFHFQNLELKKYQKDYYDKILKLFVSEFIGEMKKTPLFNSLFSETYFGGSFYDGLKLASTHQEFDLNLIMNFGSDIEVVGLSDPGAKLPNFGNLKVKKSVFQGILGQSKLDQSLQVEDSEGNLFVSASALFDIVQTSADRAISRFGGEIMLDGKTFSVKKNYIGAPYTLLLECKEDNCMLEIDFVPAIRLRIDQLPHSVVDRIEKVKRGSRSSVNSCFAIALKPVNGEKFQIDFHDIERDVLARSEVAKISVMLLKHLRDIHGGPMTKLWSHFLKTVVMNQLLNEDYSPDLEKFLVQSLRNLKDSLRVGHMPDIFFPECNLFKRIKKYDQAVADASRFLGRILNKIDQQSGYTWRTTDWDTIFKMCPSSDCHYSSCIPAAEGHYHPESARRVEGCPGVFNPRESWLKQILQLHPRSLPKPEEDETPIVNLSTALGVLAVAAFAYMSNK